MCFLLFQMRKWRTFSTKHTHKPYNFPLANFSPLNKQIEFNFEHFTWLCPQAFDDRLNCNLFIESIIEASSFKLFAVST